MSSPSPICILCQAKPAIKESHIVPAFVIRRLKKGSPLDTLIHSDRLAKTFYDGWKGPYLCAACEQDFSKLEHSFCTAVYDPFDRQALTSFKYGPELLLFAASLIFRYLHLVIERNPNKPRQPQVDAMSENLRTSLLAKTPGTITSSLYLDFFALITTPDGLPPGINQYFFRGLDGKVQDWKLPTGETMWVIFEKLPGMNFVLASHDLAQLKAKSSPIKQAISLYGIRISKTESRPS